MILFLSMPGDIPKRFLNAVTVNEFCRFTGLGEDEVREFLLD
ncbi:MAG TPA: hypothetical protein VN726_07560 [Hanamia sp.]|nr:hypothetical protein [Hanamia sp.]